MKPETMAIVAIFFGFAILEMIFTRFFNKPTQVKGDGWVEFIGIAMLYMPVPLAGSIGLPPPPVGLNATPGKLPYGGTAAPFSSAEAEA